MNAKKHWKCANCGKALPQKGKVWKWRYEKYLLSFSKNPNIENCGYYCDDCAYSQELGLDY
jgi:hypothetical protein